MSETVTKPGALLDAQLEQEPIAFGTGGWRAIIGEGFTLYNVRRLAQAVANEIVRRKLERHGVLVGFDRRFLSQQAGAAAAEVFAANRIATILLPEAAPTPLITYATALRGCAYGLAFTASHNPPEWNGLKVFHGDGSLLLDPETRQIEAETNGLSGHEVKRVELESALAAGIVQRQDFTNEYIDAVETQIDLQAIRHARLKVIVDPMYGVGQLTLGTVLTEGRCRVRFIHDRHNPLFGGRSPAPNPEALRLLSSTMRDDGYDLGLAMDGDADRIAIVDERGEYISVNDLLLLLYWYLHEVRGERGGVVRNLATTHLLDRLAHRLGEECYEVPVGFKHIVSTMTAHHALLGGESSGGLTIRGHILGKDGIFACALAVEMLAKTGQKISQLRERVYALTGRLYEAEETIPATPAMRASVAGRMTGIPGLIGPYPVVKVSQEDGTKFYLENDNWALLRFSGTEPVLRLAAEADSPEKAALLIERLGGFANVITPGSGQGYDMRYGYFDNANREYVIERPDVPVSWTNYLGVENLCSVVSHNAGGYSFFKNAEHQRVTRFRPNGVPLDRPGHYVYLRDDTTGEYWSVSWQPVGMDLARAKYECRHGLSYSKFSCGYSDLEAEQTVFIPLGDDVELWDVRIRNSGRVARELSVFSYVEFSFHHIEIDNQNLQMSLYASGSSCEDGIIEYDFFYEPWTFHYFTASFEPDSFDSLRDTFLGAYRTETNPVAVERGCCGNSAELGGNHCGALHKRITLAPGEETRIVFLLGAGSRAKGREMRAKYSIPANVDSAFAALGGYWEAKLAAFQCQTPNAALDTMINTWTLYQAETCVVWSRFASFIEVGGRNGLGYRDTAQDIMSVAHSNPRKCRQRIMELLRAQVSQGYGLHLFDPDWFDPGKQAAPKFKSPTVTPTPDRKSLIHGIADVCSDDALWLIASVCEYVKETGDAALFDELAPFADEGEATVYEHLKRALDFSAAQVGAAGICKGLRADWNDCLNLGGGESAMVSFLHHWALRAFVEAAEYLGRREDARRYCLLAEKVKAACERELWDGEWYIRGITAKGVKVGTRESEEGKIFIESNTWAVVSDAAPPERARACMDAVDRYLYSEYGIHLLWPAFSKPNDDVGFVGRVYKGIKENAAIFSHPNPWAVIAECKLGRGSRAMKFYDSLLPANQNERIETREAEPYSYCQFVMGRDHTAYGRARHPWLTGSAGWNYTAATRWILGVRPGFRGLEIDPSIPAGWKEFRVTRQWRGATFHIHVTNPDGVEKGIREIRLNGRAWHGAIAAQPMGSVHRVEVEMG